jgi:Tol biopolymer transport system component
MLLFLGLHPGTEPPVERWDAWATPALEDGKPIASGLLKRVTGLGGNAALPDDLNWTADGLVFTARAGWARNLYRCPVDAAGRTTANLVGLTNGTEIAGRVMVSRSGRAVFSSGAEKFDVWTLPVDANAGKVTGTPSRVTNGFDLAQHPTISGDGKKVLYDSSRNGISQIWLKDLVTGKESLAVTGQRGVGAGLFLPVSGRIAYRQTSGNVDLLDPGTGETRRIAEGSTLWSIDHRESLAFISGPPSTLPGIDVVDLKSLKRTRILQPQAGHPLYQAHPSPDGRWVVFLESGSASSIIYAVRFRGTEEIPRSEWIPLTEDKQGLDKPRFSPDGKLVYFTANREGSRAIDALRFDAETGHAIGAPFAVYDADTPRLSLAGVNLGALSIDVARDKIVMILAEETSNIWLADLHRYN